MIFYRQERLVLTNDLKEKIRASMLGLLCTRGYPNMTDEQIIQSLPDLWKKLESEGLLQTIVSRGFNYKHFVEIALQTQARIQMFTNMEDFFKGRR